MAGDTLGGGPPRSVSDVGEESVAGPAKKSMINGPTVLTLLRIVLVVPLVALMLTDSTPAHIAAIVCFVVASLTDFIDGRWARHAHLVTDLGAFLDPLADKMLVNLTFLVLVYQNLVPLWMFAVILVRDFAVDGMRMLSAKNGITISASIFGKLKTTVQMITIICIMLGTIVPSDPLTIVSTVLLYIVLALTLFSGADYLIKGWQQLTKSKAKSSR